MFEDEIIAGLVNCMKQAIQSGDWKVDGACDPDTDLMRAEHYLRKRGWTENSIDGHWQDAA